MMHLVDNALTLKRTVLMLSLLVIVSGMYTFFTIAKESSPDITIPIIYVSVGYRGVSPADADKLLIKPLKVKLESVDGLDEIKTLATQDYASLSLEFASGTDMDQALLDTREQVRQARADLPDDADEPNVIEVNVALFPILTIGLSGNLDERELADLAETLEDSITALPGVLEVELTGKRKRIVEVIIRQQQLEAYNLSLGEVASLVRANNLSVTTGSLISGSGSFPLQVEGLIDSVAALTSLPVISRNGEVINLGDLALVRQSYKEPDSISRVNGKPTIEIKVKKRIGANIIDTVDGVKAILKEARRHWPHGVEVALYQDESNYVRSNLSDLFNNVIFATLLVMLVVILTLGLSTALLVGLAIPTIFLSAILVLGMLGMTMNMVVLFALIMSMGMIVDGAIVVTEYADRRMLEGTPRAQAYSEAGNLMAKPIFASTITTLAAFSPLLFWPDLIGDFMQYIPITVMLALTASLLITVLVLPSLGALVGRPGGNATRTMQIYHFSHMQLPLSKIDGFTGWYVRCMDKLLHYPLRTFLGIVLLSIAILFAYAQFGKGVVFFPDTEPERGVLDVRARGNLSIYEKNRLASRVEHIVLGYKEVRVVSTTVLNEAPRNSSARDVIAQINMEFEDWQLRAPAAQLIDSMLSQANAIPGLVVASQVEEMGPPSTADLLIELNGQNQRALEQSLDIMRQAMENDGGFTEITDSRPLVGIDMQVTINREEAVRYGASVSQIGEMIKLVTSGAKIGEFIPAHGDDKIDIVLRFPQSAHTIDAVQKLRMQTRRGLVPLSQFVTIRPVPRMGDIKRVGGSIYYTLQGDVKEGEESPVAINRMAQTLGELQLADGVSWRLRGEQEDQEKAMFFLLKAFGIAFFIMLIILVTQFNSFFQAMLILSAIVFSVFGVLIGLMLRGEAFGIVMSGVGIIALSGIVVNNNIILIDTYNNLRAKGMAVRQAILGVCAQRMRPVVLTSFTTSIGLLPMVLQFNLDIVNRNLVMGSPSSQLWVQLSSAIAGGLAFSTVLTLVMTPCLLYIRERRHEKHAGTRLVPDAPAAPMPAAPVAQPG